MNCCVTVRHLCSESCNVIRVFDYSAWVNCCVVSPVEMSLVFDSLALVNCCVVVLLGRVSN